MVALVPTEPRVPSLWEGPRGFRRFRREMDRLFSDFFTPEERFGELTEFNPELNVAETDHGFEICVDLPGMKQEDLNVELENGNLLISGERKQEHEEKGKNFRRVERSYGKFCRTVPLGPDVNAEEIKAEYKDGVLRIEVPKSEAAQPKRIPVK